MSQGRTLSPAADVADEIKAAHTPLYPVLLCLQVAEDCLEVGLSLLFKEGVEVVAFPGLGGDSCSGRNVANKRTASKS